MNRYLNKQWVIWLFFLIAILLEQMPWPKEFIYYRPTWLFLILIYWIINIPRTFNVLIVFFLGIIMDLLQGSVIGVNSLTYYIICYLILYKYQFICNIVLWQQAIIIAILSVIMNFILFLIEFISSSVLFHPEIFWNCIINAILWPWIFLFLRKIQFKFLIN